MDENAKKDFNKNMNKYIKEGRMDAESARINAAIDYFKSGLGDEHSKAQFGALLEKSSLPIFGMDFGQVDVGQMDKPGDVENRFNKVRGDIKHQESKINAQKPQDAEFSQGQSDVAERNDAMNPVIDAQYAKDRSQTMEKARKDTLANLANSPVKGDAISVMALFKDGPIDSLLNWMNIPPTQDGKGNFEPTEKDWKEWSSDRNNQKELSGYTVAQTRVIEAYHKLTYASANLSPAKINEAKVELDRAANGLWNEMKETLIGDKNLEHGKDDAQIRSVTVASAHMMSQLRDIFIQKNNGAGAMVKQFNTAYELTGPKQQ